MREKSADPRTADAKRKLDEDKETLEEYKR